MSKKYSQSWWASLRPEQVGKETEKLVEGVFDKWNTRVTFAWHRLPDAKSARGALKAQPADYLYRSGSHSGFIEVKALKHNYRLPRDRVSQLATLRKWSLAGGENLVLVHHYMTGEWKWQWAQFLDPAATSWVLSDLKAYPDPESAMLSTGLFGFPTC